MARPKILLDDWRPKIEQWAKDGARRDEIQRRLREQASIKIGASTLANKLRSWDVRYNQQPVKKTDALRQRVQELFRESKGMTDEITLRVLQREGYQIGGTRALARLRKEIGLYKRVDKEKQEQNHEEVKKALRQEFGDNYELPEDLATRDLSVYLRSKYNLVGRDRIRKIAAEVNPDWVRRRKQRGLFPRNASRKCCPTAGGTTESLSPSDDMQQEPIPEVIAQTDELLTSHISYHADAGEMHVSDDTYPPSQPIAFTPSWLDPMLAKSP